MRTPCVLCMVSSWMRVPYDGLEGPVREESLVVDKSEILW